MPTMPSNAYSAVTGTMAVTLTVGGPATASRAENNMGHGGDLHGVGPRFGHGNLVD